jgi:hypothetical protein
MNILPVIIDMNSLMKSRANVIEVGNFCAKKALIFTLTLVNLYDCTFHSPYQKRF